MLKFLAKLFGAANKTDGETRIVVTMASAPKTSFSTSPPTDAPISADHLALITAKVNASAYIESAARQRVIDHLTGKTRLFETDDYLTLEEKRAMGLNTRQKLHRELTTVLSAVGMKCANPKAVVSELGLASVMDSQKMGSIIKLQASGVTKGVRIKGCDSGGDKPCAWSKGVARKVLPASAETECERRKHCNADPYCMGYYEAVLADL